MVDVSFLAEDPTIAALKSAVVAERAKQERRKYVGASGIGDACERKIWYEYNGYAKPPMDFRGCAATEDGHRTERLIIERLRKIPDLKIYNEQSEYLALDEKFKGHPEGLIEGLLQAPTTKHILEVKCCNEKKFNDLIKKKDELGEKKALEQWDKTYYAQAMILCYGFGVTRHYLVVATPGGRDIVSCRTEANNEFAKGLLSKAERIISMKTPPVRVADNPDFWICRRCGFRDECWKK